MMFTHPIFNLAFLILLISFVKIFFSTFYSFAKILLIISLAFNEIFNILWIRRWMAIIAFLSVIFRFL